MFLYTSNCPFETFNNIYKEIPDDAFVLVDFHGEATSEKQHLDILQRAGQMLSAAHIHMCRQMI